MFGKIVPVGAQRAAPVTISDKIPKININQYGEIVRSFKSAVTKRINELRQTTTPPIWQRSFYDHVIRIDTSLQNIRNYIINNPAKWNDDENNIKNYKLKVQAGLNPTG